MTNAVQLLTVIETMSKNIYNRHFYHHSDNILYIIISPSPTPGENKIELSGKVVQLTAKPTAPVCMLIIYGRGEGINTYTGFILTQNRVMLNEIKPRLIKLFCLFGKLLLKHIRR